MCFALGIIALYSWAIKGLYNILYLNPWSFWPGRGQRLAGGSFPCESKSHFSAGYADQRLRLTLHIQCYSSPRGDLEEVLSQTLFAFISRWCEYRISHFIPDELLAVAPSFLTATSGELPALEICNESTMGDGSPLNGIRCQSWPLVLLENGLLLHLFRDPNVQWGYGDGLNTIFFPFLDALARKRVGIIDCNSELCIFYAQTKPDLFGSSSVHTYISLVKFSPYT